MQEIDVRDYSFNSLGSICKTKRSFIHIITIVVSEALLSHFASTTNAKCSIRSLLSSSFRVVLTVTVSKDLYTAFSTGSSGKTRSCKTLALRLPKETTPTIRLGEKSSLTY